MKTLFLTGTIKPFVKVAHNNPEERLKEYVNTIEKYIDNTNFDAIIFAENSGYFFEDWAEILSEKAKKNNKQFEYLCCEGGDHRNMSTGEASLMLSALEKSTLLDKAKYIWKSTGRVYIKNTDKITCTNDKAVFLYSRKYKSVQTWFFGICKNDLKLLLSEQVIDDMSNDCIEYAWMRFIRNHSRKIRITKFNSYPDAEGVNSSGSLYTLSRLKWSVKNILLKIGWFTVK